MHAAYLVLDGAGRGLYTTWRLLWESLYGLTLGFVLSAIVQVAVPQRLLRRFATGSARGVATAAGFGAISSSCSYGSAAATRALYRKGADARAAFSFLVSSTNMNVAILVMFWVLVGWRFALAELFGGAIIIAAVTVGLTLLVPKGALDRLRTDTEQTDTDAGGEPVTEDAVCGMKGSTQHAVTAAGREYRFCNADHARQFASEPDAYATVPAGTVATLTAEESATRPAENEPSAPSLARLETWATVAERAWGDVKMLRTELAVGYLLAGFAEALVPRHALSVALHAIGGVPVIGYVLLLLLGLAIAVATFVCSMGNVPVAAFLKAAGVPLGANVAYIYGDLLILPLVQIYRRSFPPRLTATFLGLFVVGACLAGAAMEAVIRVLP